MKKVLLVLTAILMSSCVSTHLSVPTELIKVEAPDIENKDKGVKITKLPQTRTKYLYNEYNYEDDYIDINWYVEYQQLNFSLRNKTKQSIKIKWDDVVFVDYLGNPQRVMHSGVKYNERNNSQPPSLIPANTRLTDIIIPTNNVNYNETLGWYISNLYYLTVYSPKRTAEKMKDSLKGRRMQVLLPITFQDITKEYLFEFEIKDIILLQF